MTGVLDQFATPEWGEVLGRSWILVNSSAREGLPTAFIEAAAHRCAILSFTDPDGFATRFGCQATEGRLEEGLRSLLRDDRWRALGEAGRRHVEQVFSIEHAIDEHLRAYDSALTRTGSERDDDEPQVTVVVATHDRRDWLERCVASVLAQDGVSLQLVIVDDASTDDTSEWLGTLDDHRVIAISLRQNSGLSTVRNRGLAEARGRFVMFLDDDDWLERGALRTLSEALARHPRAVAAVGARRVWFTTEGYARRDSHPHVPGCRTSPTISSSTGRRCPARISSAPSSCAGSAASTVCCPCEDRDLSLRLAAGPFGAPPRDRDDVSVHPGQTRPANLRELREVVARRAILDFRRARRLRCSCAERRGFSTRPRRSSRAARPGWFCSRAARGAQHTRDLPVPSGRPLDRPPPGRAARPAAPRQARATG